MTIPYFPAETVWQTLTFERAIEALEEAMRGELNPENDSPRLFSEFPDGEFLLMPTPGKTFSGVKVITIAPNNPAKNLEKIQGVYVLFDTETAAPIGCIDGVSLTAIRTPAAALLGVKHMAEAAAAGEGPGETPRILTFGAGIQAVNHIRAAKTLYPNATFEVVGRRPERVQLLQEELIVEGTDVQDRSDAREDAVRNADIILCCTSTETPLFDGRLPKDTAIVAATGTHGLERREVDRIFAERAEIGVEARASALRENGNLVDLPRPTDGSEPAWWNLQDLVQGRATRSPGKPALYTGVDMSWEDLVVASVVFREGTPSRGPAV